MPRPTAISSNNKDGWNKNKNKVGIERRSITPVSHTGAAADDAVDADDADGIHDGVDGVVAHVVVLWLLVWLILFK